MSTEMIPALQMPEATEGKSKAEMREQILKLESVMKKMPNQITIPTFHHFAPGIYMREVRIPAGAVVTGHIHKTEHLNILSQGELTVYTEDGMKRLQASQVIKSQPGIKRAATAHKDSVWITVHPNPTNEQDVQKLEEMLVVETFDQLLEFMEKKQITEGKPCLS